MKNSFLLSLVAIGLSLVTCFQSQAVEKKRTFEFLAGAATADVTPKNGVSMDGAISKPGPAKGVHDPLTARAIVMKSGGTTLALAIVDMCMIEKSVYDQAKEIVQEKVGIPHSRVLAAATHSHATPRAIHIGRGPLDDAYHVWLSKQIAAAIIKAHGNLAPATVAHGSFEQPSFIKCRRFLCEPGTVGANPFGETGERIKSVAGPGGKVLRPAGPVDPQFSVLSFRHADGKPLAVLGNFSVHYCGGYAGGLVSADYFGAYAKALENKLNAGEKHPPFVGLMSNGTSGDTGSIQLNLGKAKPWDRINASGRALAEKTLELIAGLPHAAPKQLAAKSANLEFSVRKPSPERLQWAKDLLADRTAKGPHRWSRIYANETLHLADYPDRYALPLQALRIGDIAVAAAPCEIFAETGLAIKAGSPFENTFTIELANGYSGYLPTPQGHEWGGYETWAARSSHLEIGAEPKIRAMLLKLLGLLK